MPVLAQHQARHVVLLFDIPTYNEVIVLHALDFHPVLGPFSLDIHAVLPLGDDALQLLFFREPVQRFSLSFDGFGDGQPLVLPYRFLQQGFSLFQGLQDVYKRQTLFSMFSAPFQSIQKGVCFLGYVYKPNHNLYGHKTPII